MSKTIVVGDTHGRPLWKIPFYNEKWDHFIFIGDYFDTHDNITPIEQLHNFKEIMAAKVEMEEKGKVVDCLIGNHDFHYFPEIGYNGTSGYQSGAAKNFEFAIQENKDKLKMATFVDDVLFTHAGVGESWMERLVKKGYIDKLPNFTAAEVAAWVNQAWEERWCSKDSGRPYNVFNFTGRHSSGDDMGQTPIWIRPLSLSKDTHEMRKTIKQVVGHTGQYELWLDDDRTLKGRYYFTDTLGTSGEYLIIEDGKFSVGKTK